MYLSDHDLRALLPELQFKTDDPENPFNPGEQIQPSSIDVRLDRVFWRPRRGKSIDLRSARLLELEPHRHWKKIILSEGESITVRPGEMILGRTFEWFRVPPGHAGKLEGRSSFARLGLGVHCSADFINPGYAGRMPLQLTNNNPSSITLVPRLPICQLIVVRLSRPSERVYGEAELFSKYFNDDGGPSYWWRDRRIKALHEELGRRSVPDLVQQDVLKLIGPQEPELIDRFEKFVSAVPAGELTNATDLLDQFARRENRSRQYKTLSHNFQIWIGPTVLAAAITAPFFDQPITPYHYAGFAAAAVAIAYSGWYYFTGTPPGDYLVPEALRRLRSQKATSVENQANS